MNYKNRKQKYIILIFLIIASVLLFTGCEQGTGNKFKVLGFLSSGMKTAAGHKILHNTDYHVYALIPFIEPLFGWLISIFCNIIDFLLWFVAWIPGIKQAIRFIYSLPDIDQYIPNIFSNHRNFITHSIFNPGFIVIIFLSCMLSKIPKCKEVGKYILGLTALIFIVHFLADSIPLNWKGFALIHISILEYNLITLPAFLSKAWLLLNAFIAYKIFSIVTKDKE